MDRLVRMAAGKLQTALSVSRTVPLRTLAYSLRAILSASPGATLLQHPAYVPIADVPGLPRILLLGDSISIGYTLPVRRALKGMANVHRPAANCTSSRNGVQHLERWLGAGRWQIVHVNFGLHDCVRDNGVLAVPTEEYRENLVTIFSRLRDAGARLVWANTTPVSADLLYHDPTSGRLLEYRAADVATYNSIAVEAAQQYGMVVDALDACVPSRLMKLQIPNDVHFTPEGYAVLGKQVADCLRKML